MSYADVIIRTIKICTELTHVLKDIVREAVSKYDPTHGEEPDSIYTRYRSRRLASV